MKPRLRVGMTVTRPGSLPGVWSVWSQAADGPSAWFLVPVDTAAHGSGLKYAVVTCQMGASADRPLWSVLRTDPHTPEFVTANPGSKRRARQ